MRRMLLIMSLVVAGCGESENDQQVANALRHDEVARAADKADAMPVRIGELGPGFEACNAAGTTRHLAPDAALQARAAPFDSAAEAGTVAADSRFFVCTRSLDQRWLGIVWDDSGTLAERCGVSSPVPARRAYEGPCRSGWVASVSVKLAAN